MSECDIEWESLVDSYAARLGRGGQFDDDLRQEGFVALLESEGMPNERRIAFIEHRLRQCRRELKNGNEFWSLNTKPTEDGNELVDIVDSTATEIDRRSPRKRKVPKLRGRQRVFHNRPLHDDRWGRYRHRCRLFQKCDHCGRSLPNDHYMKCLICRAKKSYWQRRRRNPEKRRRSQYDKVLKRIGWDISTIRAKPRRYNPKKCEVCGNKTNDKRGRSKLCLKCRSVKGNVIKNQGLAAYRRLVRKQIAERKGELHPSREAFIVRLRNSGYRISAIGRDTGLSREVILGVLRRHRRRKGDVA